MNLQTLVQSPVTFADAASALQQIKDEHALLTRCLETFGESHNLKKTLEECLELATEIVKGGTIDVVNESVDVLICVSIIRAAHPEAFAAALDLKLARLARRIEAGDPKAS